MKAAKILKRHILKLKSQEKFKSEAHSVFTEESNETVSSANDGNRIQSIDSKETYAYETSKKLRRKNEEIKYRNIIKK